jgi:hypothetical protein
VPVRPGFDPFSRTDQLLLGDACQNRQHGIAEWPNTPEKFFLEAPPLNAIRLLPFKMLGVSTPSRLNRSMAQNSKFPRDRYSDRYNFASNYVLAHLPRPHRSFRQDDLMGTYWATSDLALLFHYRHGLKRG